MTSKIKKLTGIEYQDGIVWVDKSEHPGKEFPVLVMEKLTSGRFHPWQVDNINDVDKERQFIVYGQSEHFNFLNIPYIEFSLSSTNSPLGSSHNIRTLYSQINHIGEFMEKNFKSGNESSWGNQLKRNARELLLGIDKVREFSEEDMRAAMEFTLQYGNPQENFGQYKKDCANFINTIKNSKSKLIEMEINVDLSIKYSKDNKTYLKVLS